MALTQNQMAPFLELNARTAIGLSRRAAKDSDTSFFGGYPTLPKDVPWPRDPDGKPCIFLAQVNLADVPVRPAGWPERGIVFIFLNAALEDRDDEIALDKTENEDETGELDAAPLPFLYYATADQAFALRRPDSPIHARSYFWYTGNGTNAFSNKDDAALDLDALPKGAWDFVTFTDYNYPLSDGHRAGENPVLSAAETAALDGVEMPPEEIAAFVRQQAIENRDARAHAGAQPSRFGGFEHIDPGFELRATWWGRPYVYEQSNVPLDPYFADWPHAAKVIFYHAKAISFEGDYGADKANAVDSLSRRIVVEARDWMNWAKENLDAEVPEDIKQAYRVWCRSIYAKCFAVCRPKLLDAPRVTKPMVELRRYFYNKLPAAMRKARQEVRASHSRRISAIENLLDPVRRVKDATAGGGSLDQLFGYGENIQTEADTHRSKTLVFQSWGLPDISFGDGTFKLWLATDRLEPNAWQKVVAMNAVT